MDEMTDDCILYELLVYSEWKQDPEYSKVPRPGDNLILSVASPSHSLFNILQYVSRRDALTDDILRLLLHQLPWQFAVGENGKVVAILQETSLEIRITRDEYSSVVGKAAISRDSCPQWRKLTWSPDCNMLAIAQSSGIVSFYDLLGSNIFTIFPPKFHNDTKVLEPQNPVVSIIFLQSRIKNPKWSSELVVVDYHGHLTSYLVSPTDGFQENHSFSFAPHYRQGVAAVSYHPAHNLLFVAGSSGLNCGEMLKDHGSSVGLSAWRILNDYPYYRLALSNDEEQAMLQAQRSLWNWMPALRAQPKKNVIFKMQVSPEGKLLVCLHSCGSISVWHLPAIRLYKFWHLRDQPDFDVRNPHQMGFADKRRFRTGTGDDHSDYHPVDVNWWSEQAVIIARYSGAVSVCSVVNLRNLLGESPEFLAGQPQVSALCSDRGFLGLECETVHATKKRPLDDLSSFPSDTESSDEEEDGSLLNRSSALIQSAVYMVTDMERFQPRRKRPKVVQKTFRLLGLKSTTPEELYARKIDNEEYGDALDLARTYNLDCDLVYQRQWRNSDVAIDTIRDYLSKITKRSWVLAECVQRVPETFDAALELLEFGLRGTNLETLIAIGEGTDGGHFVLRSPELEGAEMLECLDEDVAMERAAQRTQQLLSKVDVHNLTEEQRDLVRYRRTLLHYLDMLHTYEKIEGESRLVEIVYDHTFYARFRCAPALSSSVEFARESRCHAVHMMLTYHGTTVLPHWLPVLSNFPETTSPYQYENMLPECATDGTVFPWGQLSLREQDWCEHEDFRLALGDDDDDGENFLYEDDPALQRFNCPINALTAELLSEWYLSRVHQIESCSHMVDHALFLVKLAQARNIEDLDSLYNQLVTLESLVYDVHLEDASLSALQKLSDLEQAKLLMSKTSEATFVEDVRHVLLPFLGRCERQVEGSKLHLLHGFLLDLSGRDLAMPLRLLEQAHTLGLAWEQAVELALDCLYTYPNADQLDIALQMTDYMAHRSLGTASGPLHTRLEELKCDVGAASVLKANGLPKPLAFVRDCKVNAAAVQPLLIKLARTVAKQIPPPNKMQWDQLLSDMLTLQSKVFKCVSRELCYEIYAETLLSSGNISNIRAAADILEVRQNGHGHKHVPFERSVLLVLQVAREYFDSAGSLIDSSMDLAKTCLHLIVDENDVIQENLDLIASLQLLSDFGLTMLPLQVRQCTDRLRLVDASIRKKPAAYRSSQRLLQLAQKLRVCGSDSRQREGKVLAIIAETALEEQDYEFCAEVCRKLVAHSHTVGWPVVQQLGQCPHFPDLHLRRSLMAFALLHCPAEAIEPLVQARSLLEAELLHQNITNQALADEDEFSDALTSPVSPQKEFPPTNLSHTVGRSTEAIRQTTYKLIHNVSNKDFWKNTFSWGRDEMVDTSPCAEDDDDALLSRQGFPAFYASLAPNCHTSRLVTCYDRFSVPDMLDSKLEVCQAMMRTMMLEKSATEDHTAVLCELAQRVMPEDCCVGLALLLAVPNLKQADVCFRSLPYTSVMLQLATYYFAIKGYWSLTNTDADKTIQSDVFLYPPSQLVDYVAGLAPSQSVSESWTEFLAQYRTLLADYLQGQLLQASGCGVDLERFTRDDQYRRDSILGLAMTIDTERFQLAVSLGARHNVPVAQVAAEHVCALLLSRDDVPLSELSTRLGDSQLLGLLQSQPHLVCERLTQQVYPSVAGTEHQLFLLYYGVLNTVAEHYVTHALSPLEHVRLLKKVKATSPDIDYKRLVESPNDVLEVLRPVLSSENVGLVAKLVKSLPEALGCTTQTGAVYSIWAQHHFFQISTSVEEVSGETCVKQFESCSQYFSKMVAVDMVNFVKGVCFSEASLELMDMQTRQKILEQAVFLCQQRSELQKVTDLSKGWSEASMTLGCWLSHLQLLSSNQTVDIHGDHDPDLQDLFRQLDLSRGEAGPILCVLQSAVLSSVPLRSLQLLLQLLPQPLPSLKQLLEDLLNVSIAGIRGGSDPDAVTLLPAVLRRMQENVEQGDPSSTTGNAWKQLQSLCGDTSLSPEIRLQALKLVQSLQGMPETSGKLLLFHHTQAAVSLAWPEAHLKLQEEDLGTEQARLHLIGQLVGSTTKWRQVETLLELLTKWPPFEGPDWRNTLSNPWLQTIQKMLQLTEGNVDDIGHMLENIFEKTSFSEECLQEMVAQAEGSSDLSPLLMVCLLSDHAALHRMAVSLLHKYYHSGDEALAPWLCSLLIQRGLTPLLVATPVYAQLVQHLLGAEDNKLPTPNTVASQLAAGGSVAEAGTLQLLHMGAPRSLTVFSSALQLARRMLAEE